MKKKQLKTKPIEPSIIVMTSQNLTWIKLKPRDNLVSNFIKVVLFQETL